MHKLFVPRHALETDFRATACNFCLQKMLFLPCEFGHSLDVGFPIFKNYPRKKAELVSISKIGFLSSQ